MPFRLFAAAAMVAIAATLGLMVVRAVLSTVIPFDPADTDALLLHHLGLGLAGSLLMLPLLLKAGASLRQGVQLGGAIFLVFCLLPWLAQPQTLPGRIPADLVLWLFSVAAGTAGLWLLRWPDWQRRLAGLLLMALPLLLGYVMADRPDTLTTPGFGPGFGDARDPDIAVWRDLALNLLFWLLLGAGSSLSARRLLARKAPPKGETGA